LERLPHQKHEGGNEQHAAPDAEESPQATGAGAEGDQGELEEVHRAE
jgi:hypothetical protein